MNINFDLQEFYDKLGRFEYEEPPEGLNKNRIKLESHNGLSTYKGEAYVYLLFNSLQHCG